MHDMRYSPFASVPTYERWSERIASGHAIISVIGLGYAGLPLLRALSWSGFQIVGLDIDRETISALNSGKFCTRHIPDSSIVELRDCTLRRLIAGHRS